jgi:hypothetical protein
MSNKLQYERRESHHLLEYVRHNLDGPMERLKGLVGIFITIDPSAVSRYSRHISPTHDLLSLRWMAFVLLDKRQRH